MTNVNNNSNLSPPINNITDGFSGDFGTAPFVSIQDKMAIEATNKKTAADAAAAAAESANFANGFGGFDLETAMMAVQMNRANQLEVQLKGQIDAVQARNENIAKLNSALATLNGIDSQFAAGAAADAALGDKATPAAKQQITESSGLTINNKSDVATAISKIKSLIDAQSNTQQSDMLRLQSLSNKRNEAFDIMTNFMKKAQDSRSSIIGNMR